MEAPAPLGIHLLGGFRVAVHGRVVPAEAWRQRRSAAVVKLLALAPAHRLHREQLIEALWPELDGEAAANNLRVAMHRARRRLADAGAPPDQVLVRDGEDLLLAASDAVTVDVDAFEAALARAWLSEEPAASRAALDRYPGDLLPEDLYEDWAASRRAELRASHLTLLARLAQLHEQRGELGRAIATLQRLLHAEPLDEPAHAALIALFARAGETRQADTQFERLSELLERELGAPPDTATRDLMAAIHGGRFPEQIEPLEPLVATAPLIEASAAPAPRPPRGNLPAAVDEIIGREREIAELRRLLANHRLITLTGPAGVGKTRLALSVAHATGSWRGGAYFADLSPLRDPDLVLPAVALALGVAEEAERPLRDAVADRLGGEPLLLLLDNFEQITAAAPQVADLLAACPGLHVLVTSRVRLRLRGEQEYPVQPLAVTEVEDGRRETEDGTGDRDHASRLPTSPAVRLFVVRAQEVDPAFTLIAENSEAVAATCHSLDGLPLAIELAAARVRILSPSALLSRLERPLALLTGGPRDAPQRQQTLRAAIAWSHDLLSVAEQSLFRRLAVFSGGFTLDAAEDIAGMKASESAAALDLIASLAEQSLLRRVSDSETGPRFGMLETIREFALEQLELSGEAPLIRSRHAAFFLALGERLEPELTGPEATARLDELEREHDNLRAALATLAGTGDADAHLRLAGALWRFWWLHGHLGEGRVQLARALEAEDGDGGSRANAFNGAGALAAAQGDLDRAAALHGEALRLWRMAGDRRGEVSALTNLGLLADERGDPRQAATYLQEALALARAADDRRGLAIALANLGQVAMTLEEHQRAAALLGDSVAVFRELGDERSQAAILANLGILALFTGDFTRAQACHEQALDLLRALGDRQGEAHELLNLGDVLQQRGDLERAAALYVEARERLEELGDRSGVAFAHNYLGRLAHQRGEESDAESLLGQGLSLALQIGDRVAVAESLEGLATVACAQGDAARGVQLLGAAEALREAIGVPLPAVYQADYRQALSEARRALGEVAFRAAREEGVHLALTHFGADLAGLPAGDNAAVKR